MPYKYILRHFCYLIFDHQQRPRLHREAATSLAQVNLRGRRCRRGGGEGCSYRAGRRGAQCTCVPDHDEMKGDIHMSLWAFVFLLKGPVSLNLRNVQLYLKLFMTLVYRTIIYNFHTYVQNEIYNRFFHLALKVQERFTISYIDFIGIILPR